MHHCLFSGVCYAVLEDKWDSPVVTPQASRVPFSTLRHGLPGFLGLQLKPGCEFPCKATTAVHCGASPVLGRVSGWLPFQGQQARWAPDTFLQGRNMGIDRKGLLSSLGRMGKTEGELWAWQRGS